MKKTADDKSAKAGSDPEGPDPNASAPTPKGAFAGLRAELISAMRRLTELPTLLEAVSEMTGMRFVVVAHVTKGSWTALSVLDKMEFGLEVGGELDVTTTLCSEVRDGRAPVVIGNASEDTLYCNHPTPKQYGIESYIAVPIILKSGDFFGTLCAIDTKPADLSANNILPTFELFARLIAVELDRENNLRALMASEERYRAFIANSSEAIWRFEVDEPVPVDLPVDEQIRLAFERGYLAECNDTMARQYGFETAEQLTGVRLPELMVADDPNNYAFLKAFIESGYNLAEAESHERDANGNDRYFLNNFTGVVENGHLLRAWGSQREITQTKTQNTATARLAAIVTSSDDAIISKDVGGLITSWNRAAEQMFGYSADEAIGSPIDIIIPPRLRREESEIIDRIRDGENIHQLETVRRRKDGADIEVAVTVSPIFDDSGNVIGASKIARDITERRRAQETLDQNQLMLTLAMQGSRMGAWERDIASDMIWWSEELEAIFGLEPGEFRGTREHYDSLIHEDDREAAAEAVKSAIDEHRPYVMEFRFYHADGSIRWMEGRGQAVYSQSGVAVRIYGTGIDITERRMAEQRSRFLNSLDQAVQAISQPEEVMSVTARMLGEYLEVNRCAYAEVDDDEDTFHVRGDYTRETFSIVGDFKMSDFGDEALRLMRSNQPYVVNDAKHDPRVPNNLDAYSKTDIVAVICLPLHKNGKFAAAMAVHQKTPRFWTREEIDLVQTVVRRCWESLERARAARVVRESDERFRLALSSGAVTVYEQDLELRYKWVYPDAPYDPEVIGKTDRELSPGSEGELLMRLKAEVLKTGEPIREEVRARALGTEHSYDLLVEARRDADGAIIGVGGTALDITEQKRLQEELSESEMRFRSLMEQAPFSVQLFDIEGYTIGVNRAWEDLWGVKLDQMSDYNVLKDPQLEAKGIAPFIRQAFAGEPAELPAIKYDPEETIPGRSRHAAPSRWVSAVAYPLKGPDGKVYEVALIHQDITARHEAQEALRAHQERQVLLLELLRGNRETLDPARIMQTATEAVGRHLGANRVGFFEMTDDDTLEFGPSWTDRLLEPLTGLFPISGFGSRYLAEVRAERTVGVADVQNDPLTADSTLSETGVRSLIGAPIIRNGRWSAGLYVHHSEVREWTIEEISLVRDVADQTWDAVERARAQIDLAETRARLETTLAATEIGTWLWDPVKDVLTSDENLTRIFGVAPEYADGVPVQKYLDVLHPDDRESTIAALTEALGSESGQYEIDYRVVGPDGAVRWVAGRGKAERNADGTLLRMPGVAIDITARKEAESLMQRYQMLSEHARDVIWLLRPNGDIVEVNRAAVETYGYTREELLGMNVRDLRHKQTLPQLESDLEKAAAGSVHFETIHTKKDGTPFPVEVTSSGAEIGGERYLMSIIRDTTERKQAEAVLRESEERFAKAFNASPLVLTITSLRTGKLTEVNQTFIDVTGYTREEAIGRSTSELELWDRNADRTEELLELDRTGAIRNKEYVFRMKDGKEVIGLLSAEVIEIGGETSALTVIQDVTERRAAEEKMRASEQRYRNLADAMPQLVWTASADGVVDYYNSLASNYDGIDFDPRTNRWNWNMVVHPDDLAATQKAWSNAQKSGNKYEAEHRIKMIDGSYRWHLSRALAVEHPGEIGGRRWFGTATDIHDHRMSQEALVKAERRATEEYQNLLGRIVPLAETLGRARDLVTIYRKVGEFIRASMPCSAFFVSFFDPDTHLRSAAYVWGDDGEVDISNLPPILLTDDGGPNSQAVYQKRSVIINSYMDLMRTRPHLIVNENGIDPLSSVAVPMMVMDRVIGTFEVQAYEDNAFITEHVVALEMAASLAAVAIENVRLIQIEAGARSVAESANRAKDEFLSVLSHELRTPLNAMLGWVRMLRSDVLDPESATKALEVIERNTRLQASLIEDLLDVSRIISGKMRIETEVSDLLAVVSTVSETVGPLAEAKNVHYEFINDGEKIFLDADPVRLQQVVSNLVQNAIKFTPAGGSVKVKAKRSSGEAIVTVTDTGVGIEPEFLPYIFDRFRQADASTRRSYAGLGLGLTIARTIIAMHGGDIEVTSGGPDKGSTFTVRLPLAGEFYSPRPSEDTLLTSGGSELKGVRILLVDDDAESLIPVKLFLESHEAHADTACSAAEALEKLGSTHFDILISDIGMPEVDGFELITTIRSKENGNATLTAIALTAYASQDDREKVAEAGFNSHLAKPINFDELLKTLKGFV